VSNCAARLLIAAAIGLGGCGGDDDKTARGGTTPPAMTPARTTPSVAEHYTGKPILIAALGDSITAGSPLYDPASENRRRIGDGLNPQSQYEYWAREKLGSRVRFRNCGVFGETTAEIARRLDACVRGAGALIVQGGINDIAQGRKVADAARHLEAMVRRGRELGLRVGIVEVLPWTNGHPDADGPIRDLNRRIAAIARGEKVTLYRWYRLLDDPSRPGTLRPELTIDGDHPAPPGYRILGEAITVPR